MPLHNGDQFLRAVEAQTVDNLSYEESGTSEEFSCAGVG